MKKLDPKKAEDWFHIGNNEFGFACLGLNDKQDRFYAQNAISNFKFLISIKFSMKQFSNDALIKDV